MRWTTRLGFIFVFVLSLLPFATVGRAEADFVPSLPGDIATSAGTPLVAAHSTFRAMYQSYDGPVMQLTRTSDGASQTFYPSSTGGLVNSNAILTFCGNAGNPNGCGFSTIYDQSGNGNDVTNGSFNRPMLAFWWANGQLIPYAWVPGGSTFFNTGSLNRRTNTHGIPTGSSPISEYAIFPGEYWQLGSPGKGSQHYGIATYGDMESTIADTGAGHMFAVDYGNCVVVPCYVGNGPGPFGAVDMENGLFVSSSLSTGNANEPSLNQALGVVYAKTNGTTMFTLEGGNAYSSALSTYWNGNLPSGYQNLQMEGGIGIFNGGDGTGGFAAAFMEGAIVAAETSSATDQAIQADIASVFVTNSLRNTAPSASSWGSDNVNVYALGGDGNEYLRQWSSANGWSGWALVGGPDPGAVLSPASESRTTSISDVFTTGGDQSIDHIYWQNGRWSSWTSLGGIATSEPSAASWGSDRQDVFVRGSDFNIWQDWWTSETGWRWQQLSSPSGGANSAPAAAERGNNLADLFVKGPGNDISEDSWNGSGWSSWTDLGGPGGGANSAPAVCSWSSDRLSLYTLALDGNVYENYWSSEAGWSGWHSEGAPAVGATSTPACTSRIFNYLDLFVRGADGHLYTKTWNGSSWDNWWDFGMP